MMNKSLERAFSQFYKNFFIMTSNYFRLTDMTIWPLTLLLSFLLLTQALTKDPDVIALVILGMMGWQAVQQTQMGIASGYMD